MAINAAMLQLAYEGSINVTEFSSPDGPKFHQNAQGLAEAKALLAGSPELQRDFDKLVEAVTGRIITPGPKATQ